MEKTYQQWVEELKASDMELVKIKAETAKMKEMHLELLTAEQEGRIDAISQSVKDVIQSCSVYADLMLKMLETSQEILRHNIQSCNVCADLMLKMLETSQEVLRHELGIDEVSCSE